MLRFLTVSEPQPISQKTILQVLAVVLVLTALAGGYFEVQDENWQARFDAQKAHSQLRVITPTKGTP